MSATDPLDLLAAVAADFARDGYAIVPDALDPATCAALRARAEALVDAFDPLAAGVPFTTDDQQARDAWFLDSGDRIRCFLEDGALVDGRLAVPRDRAVNKIGHALHARDPVFAPASTVDRWRPLLAAAGVTDPRAVQSMYIVKGPGQGGEVAPHQDGTFLYTEPLTTVGVWLALADADRHNGCLWGLPGAHRGPLRRRYVREGDTTRFVELDATPVPPFGAEGWVPLEVPAGAAILLDARLPHASERNTSARPRPAYAIHFVDRAARWAEDNWIVPIT
ncbi:MAG: phytanoyl-CoA dioxygenase family protein [bacterium]